MNALALQNFGFGEQLVRVVDRDGGAWFVANDVCAALEIGNPRQAIANLDEDEKGVITTDTLGGAQRVSIISESGLYALIFRSRKPIAVQFRKWVTGEVLPALRRTGRFDLSADNDGETGMMAVPETMLELESEKVRLQRVKVAQSLGGVAAGRKMWELCGFPPIFESAADRVRLGAGSDALTNEANRPIGDWMEVNCDVVAGHREDSMVLYASYAEWAAGQELPIVSVTAFGRYLRALGFHAVKAGDGHRQRVGLKLRG